MYITYNYSALSVLVTIVLSGIQNNIKQNTKISLIVFKVINNLEFKYKAPLLIYIPILLPFNYILLGIKVIFGDNSYRHSVAFFYSLPINKKVYRLLKTLSLLIFYSNNNRID